jgi:Domain of unknown function (DUF4168)
VQVLEVSHPNPITVMLKSQVNFMRNTDSMLNAMSRLNPTQFSRLTIMGCLSVVATFATVFALPGISPTGHIDRGVAMAQDDPFERYVRAAFEIEKQRRSMMGQVKTITGGNVPGNVCANLGALADETQRNEVKGICGNFAKVAAGAVKKNNLSAKEFNGFQGQAGTKEQQQRINDTIQKLQLK